MQFGPVPLSKAEGAILAHSLSLPGRRLRKGVVLSAQDLEDLAGAGVHEVVVARLGADDIDENAAAHRLAVALTRGAVGVSLTEAFTGRVNIVAIGPGVAGIARPAIDGVNACDPMITCATVPPLSRVRKGSLVATIKIISYGVPEAALREAEEAAVSDGPALSLLPTQLKTARLIVTETQAAPSSQKGITAMRGRLEALGMTLHAVAHVAHRADTIAAALGEGHEDVVLILTASATSDFHDVAPAAVRLAGGEVERFGMPVDPGNLLFLGSCAGRVVIGLPGCARSPALNGADFVLERLACGLAVTGSDIAAMGVGGLLKEIPQRPQPRRGPTRG